MSITTTTTTPTPTTSNSASNDPISSSSGNHPHSQHFVNERYPKTCLEDIPSIMLEYPPRKSGVQPSRSHHSLRFRTQPVTLTEINETDEENKHETTHQQDSRATMLEGFHRLEHLALSETIRQSTRKKIPLKNYLERQRLKAMREEPSETDGN